MSSKELEFVIANLVQKVDLLGKEVKDLRARLENVEVQVSETKVMGGQVHQPRTDPVKEVEEPAVARGRPIVANLVRELESTGTGVPESFSASKGQCKMGEDVVDDSVVTAFDELSLKPMLLRGIYSYGYERPSDVQQRALIPLISGRDVIVQAQNGDDRTVTYSIAILQQINPENPNCQALVLAPTRELALQILKVVLALGEYMGATCHACIGGTKVSDDKTKLEAGVQILVGTPGRVFDMMNRRFFPAETIKIFVLDDFDELFSRGFKDQVLKVHKKMNKGTQMITLATSTSPEVLDSITKLMFDPAFISTKHRELELTLARVKQFYINVEREEGKLDALLDIFDTLEVSRAVVICNTPRNVDWLTQKMREKGLTVSAANGHMSAIEREVFRSGSSRVMITTESLSRVIDAGEVFFVVNYDLPKCPENYYYRICLCGHPGRKGVVINFVTDEEQLTLKGIEEFYNTQIMEILSDVSAIFKLQFEETFCSAMSAAVVL